MRNIPALRFAGGCAIAVVASFPTVALAHPGHDGHELTWDLGHLAAHPWTTTFWLVVIGASAVSALQILHSYVAARSTAGAKRTSSSA